MIRIDNRLLDEFIRRSKQGDKDAFNEMCKQIEPWLLNAAERFTHDSEMSRDVVQETLLKAYQNLESYREEGRSFSDWVYVLLRKDIPDADKEKLAREVAHLDSWSHEPSSKGVREMRCFQFRPWLPAYAEGDIESERVRLQVQNHLRQCERCRKDLTWVDRLTTMVRHNLTPEDRQRLLRQVRQAPARRSWPWKLASSLGALAVALLVSWIVFFAPSTSPPPRETAPPSQEYARANVERDDPPLARPAPEPARTSIRKPRRRRSRPTGAGLQPEKETISPPMSGRS
ncbi:MAG: zf-HC2 domain-containing protein [Planctomycetes bacterium]|nr:zf-HC2 domain-containing protein [Planctomycetota bacterium]